MRAALRNTMRDTLVDEFKKDARVQAIWIGGSVGRGEEDLYSDLDFYVAVEDAVFETFFAEIPQRIDLLYPILHYADDFERKTSMAERVWYFYFQEFPVHFRADLHVHTISSAKGADPDQRRELIYGEWDVVYDPHRLLTLLPPVDAPGEEVLRSHLQEKIDSVVWNFVMVGNSIRREKFWQTAESLSTLRNRVLYLLAMEKDARNYLDGYERRLRKTLSGEQLSVLDRMLFGPARGSQIGVAEQLFRLYEGAARSLCEQHRLSFPGEFVERVQTMYTEIKNEDV
jgi:predicted nucleotidyltransferase